MFFYWSLENFNIVILILCIFQTPVEKIMCAIRRKSIFSVESAHFKENTLSHPNLSVKFCPVAYHLRSEMGAYVFI
jgi:hypothetical protein